MDSPTSPGSGDYGGSSNIGPFTLYSQLGATSSPLFENTGFNTDSKYGTMFYSSPPFEPTTDLDRNLLRSLKDFHKEGIDFNWMKSGSISWLEEDAPGIVNKPYSKQILEIANKLDKTKPWDTYAPWFKTDGTTRLPGSEVPKEKYDVHSQYNFRNKEQTRDDATNPYLSGVTIAGSRQPYILRTLTQGGVLEFTPSHEGEDDDYTSYDPRRGMFGAIPRTIDDELRIGSFMLSDRGITFMAKQMLLHTFNPRKESRLWQANSIFKSLPPTAHARSNTLLDMEPGGNTLGNVFSVIASTATSFIANLFGADDSSTYESTIKGGTNAAPKSLLHLSALKIGPQDKTKLIKTHNKWRTTIAHKMSMVPSYGGSFDGDPLPKDGGNDFGISRDLSKMPHFAPNSLTPIPAKQLYDDTARYIGKPSKGSSYKWAGGSSLYTFLPGNNIMIGALKPTAYTEITSVFTEIKTDDKKIITQEAVEGVTANPGTDIISYHTQDLPGGSTDSAFDSEEMQQRFREVSVEEYNKWAADGGILGESEFGYIGGTINNNGVITRSGIASTLVRKITTVGAVQGVDPVQEESYMTYAYAMSDPIVTTADIPFAKGTNGWRAAGSPLARGVMDMKSGKYDRAANPIWIKEDGVYWGDIYRGGTNHYSTGGGIHSRFTSDKTNQTVQAFGNIAYQHDPSRSDPPEHLPGDHSIKITHHASRGSEGIVTMGAWTETEGKRKDVLVGDKATWQQTIYYPHFMDGTIRQSVFHTIPKGGIIEFAGDEFGDNFRNLGLDNRDSRPDILGGSGLLKSKYYIKGKAEDKYLAPKGGHRIGIGTDVTGIGKLIAISAINYRHPIAQWPSTPRLKIAYAGDLTVQA